MMASNFIHCKHTVWFQTAICQNNTKLKKNSTACSLHAVLQLMLGNEGFCQEFFTHMFKEGALGGSEHRNTAKKKT